MEKSKKKEGFDYHSFLFLDLCSGWANERAVSSQQLLRHALKFTQLTNENDTFSHYVFFIMAISAYRSLHHLFDVFRC